MSEVELRLKDGEEEVEGGVLAAKGGAPLHCAVKHHQGDDEEQEEEEEEEEERDALEDAPHSTAHPSHWEAGGGGMGRRVKRQRSERRVYANGETEGEGFLQLPRLQEGIKFAILPPLAPRHTPDP